MTRTLRRWLAPAAVAVATLGVFACKPSTGGKGTSPTSPSIGGVLYSPQAVVNLPNPATDAEPIVAYQGVVEYDETITLSAEVDGKLEMVSTPLDEATRLGLPVAGYLDRRVGHPRDVNQKHVRLVDGDPIRQGQLLATLDDSQAQLDVVALQKSMKAAEEALKQSRDAVTEYDAVLKRILGLPVASELEKAQYRVQLVQAKVSEARLNQEYVKFVGDLDKATDRRQRHDIRSPFDGRVVRVLRPRGVVVKAGEPILEVQNTARFRVEAQVKGELGTMLESRLPLPVFVEPVRVARPEPYTVTHNKEVTGLAVFAWTGKGATRPVVVSASADRDVKVWDAQNDSRAVHTLPHPTAVRGVAAVARGESRLVATGDGNGKVRLWDVSNPDQLPSTPTHEFEEAHAQGVGAVAFSPDGQYLATAAGRNVFVWDVATRKRKYALPADHRDDVKAVHFTPQATLVTVCRDKAIRVWKLGTDGAGLERTFDNRSGTVDLLGVSADGGRVLFDQSAGKIEVKGLADGRVTSSLLNGGAEERFSTLAVFGPDGTQVLTGAGDADGKGELQVWGLPASGRGTERQRLATAFSPDPAHRFVAAGTKSGGVHFWLLRPDQPPVPGKLVSVTRQDGTTALLRVEVDNKDGKYSDHLEDRGTARLVIDPNAKATPPGPMPPVPAPAVPMKIAAPPGVPLVGQ
jgi:WD40 repeat protein/biotin carboxyl carrier protein